MLEALPLEELMQGLPIDSHGTHMESGGTADQGPSLGAGPGEPVQNVSPYIARPVQLQGSDNDMQVSKQKNNFAAKVRC